MGGVHSEPAEDNNNNKYNQNFRNRFCSCAIDYDPHQQKGTMFQCLGLGTHEDGGCGEDWYHPGCLMGLGPKWYESAKTNSKSKENSNIPLPTILEHAPPQEDIDQSDRVPVVNHEDEEDAPLPEGFPGEDDFEHFICYKCVDANPWIKNYAATLGFLPPVYLVNREEGNAASSPNKRQRETDDDEAVEDASNQTKRIKSDEPPAEASEGTPAAVDTRFVQPSSKVVHKAEDVLNATSACKLDNLPPTEPRQFSLFVKDGFRDQFCRCSRCFPHLQAHPQLLEEEEVYEPPLTDDASEHGSTQGSGSVYERGESALRNVDRVRAIEGVMAYNHMKEKLKPFFEQFAGSGKAISAEDVKNYFAKLRGDEGAVQDAGEAAAKTDHHQEQSGY